MRPIWISTNTRVCVARIILILLSPWFFSSLHRGKNSGHPFSPKFSHCCILSAASDYPRRSLTLAIPNEVWAHFHRFSLVSAILEYLWISCGSYQPPIVNHNVSKYYFRIFGEVLVLVIYNFFLGNVHRCSFCRVSSFLVM